MYLVAIIDGYNRYVVSWELSNTLDADFCIHGLNRALERAQPDIFNTDQGCQFTSHDFLAPLQEREITISMDSKVRAMDNIFAERLWRSVKYEWLFTHKFQTVPERHGGLNEYFEFYNTEELHQSLDYNTPKAIHFA